MVTKFNTPQWPNYLDCRRHGSGWGYLEAVLCGRTSGNCTNAFMLKRGKKQLASSYRMCYPLAYI